MGLLSRGDDSEGEAVEIDDPEARTWEYKVVSGGVISRKSSNADKYNELDAEGWEYLDSHMANGTTTAIVFRRPYPGGEDAER